MKYGSLSSLFLGFLILGATALFTGCGSTGSGDTSYYTPQETVSPIEGASSMQDRLGQITRSNMR